MPASYTQGSYQGIVDAFNQVRAAQGLDKRGYDPNYRGIIEAILDVRKWGQADGGELPPGWKPEYDQDGNVIGGGWDPVPDNGTLWFDERQGRLFVFVDDGFDAFCGSADSRSALHHVTHGRSDFADVFNRDDGQEKVWR